MTMTLTVEDITTLEGIVMGDPMLLDPELGLNNDELLHLGIGYGIPGPLSIEDIQSQAHTILVNAV